MAFLTINGMTVPVARREGPSDALREIIGDSQRSANGTLFLQRTAIKRSWRFQTKPMQQADAVALINLLLGEGHRWQFGPLSTTDRPQYFISGDAKYLYSDTGLGPTGTPVATAEGNTAADGTAVVHLISAPSTYLKPAKFSAALEPFGAVTNALSADARDAENAPTGYTAVNGSAISGVTTHKWQGTKSLKTVTTAGAQRGYDTDVWVSSLASGSSVVGSVYLRGDAGGEALTVRIIQGGTTVIGSVDVVLPASGWARVHVVGTTSVINAQLNVRVIDTNAGDANTWYSDGFMLFGPASLPQPWVDGARGNNLVSLPMAYFKALKSFSISYWTQGTWANASDHGYVFRQAETTNVNEIRCYIRFDTGRPSLQIAGAGGTLKTVVGTSNLQLPTNITQRHVAVTYDNKTGALKLYVDGVLEASDTVTDKPDYSNIIYARVGDGNTTLSTFRGALSDLRILPYAMSAAEVAALAAAASVFPALRQVVASGDAVDSASVNAIASDVQSTFLPRHNGPTWAPNYLAVRFTLSEV